MQGIVSNSQMYYVHIDVVQADEELVDHIDGGNTNNEHQSLLHRIKLIGTVDAIEEFQILLNYQMHEWREIIALKAKLAHLYQQLLAKQKDHSGFGFSICLPQHGQYQQSSKQSSKQSSMQSSPQQQFHSSQPFEINMANAAARIQSFHKSLSPKNFAEAVKANMH